MKKTIFRFACGGFIVASLVVALTACETKGNCPSDKPYYCSGHNYCCPSGYRYHSDGASMCYATKSDCMKYAGSCIRCK